MELIMSQCKLLLLQRSADVESAPQGTGCREMQMHLLLLWSRALCKQAASHIEGPFTS